MSFAMSRHMKKHCHMEMPPKKSKAMELLEPHMIFNSTGLIGIRIMVYYNSQITGQYNPLYTLNNPGFLHCSLGKP